MRVAVTTAPGPVADRLTRSLHEAGLVPVRLPCIRVAPAPPGDLERLRAAAEEADWVVVTSQRAVEIVWPDGGMPARPAVAAVGPRTADAVRRAGGRVAVTGAGGGAELRRLLAGRVAGRQVVFPHSRLADPATARFLTEDGANLTALAAYDTEPIPPDDDPVDAATFASPSAVAGWTMSRTLAGVVCAAMGGSTAAALASAGAPAVLVPDEPGFAGLVELLERSPR